MTYFLDDAASPTAPVATAPASAPPTWLQGLGAAFSKAQLTNDANLRLKRETDQAERRRADQVIAVMGVDPVMEAMRAQGRFRADSGLSEDRMRESLLNSQSGSLAIIELGRQAAKADPAAWAKVDLSQEGVDAEVNAKLQKELADAQFQLDMMTGGVGAADLIGGIGGMTADIKNLPFLLVGGGTGSILKIAGREALLNVAAEGVAMPSQFTMAERLDIADPDVVSQLALAAIGGAALGGGIEALSRGISYFRSRQTAPEVQGITSAEVNDAIDAAEEAIAAGENPFEAMTRTAEASPPPAPMGREPIYTPPEPVLPVEAPDPVVRTVDDNEVATLESVLADAQALGDTRKSPLLGWIRRSAGPNARSRAKAEREGRVASSAAADYRIDPNGTVSQELKARGITPKTAPGIFKTGGRTNLDNIVASEMEDSFPGISGAAGVSDDGIYLDQDGLIELLSRDAAGDNSWLRTRDDVQRVEAQLADAERGRTAEELFAAKQPAERGLFVEPPAQRGFDDPNYDEAQDAPAIGAEFDAYMAERFPGITLTRGEREEIVGTLVRDGGDAEYLMEAVITRDLRYGEAKEPDPFTDLDDAAFARYWDEASGVSGPGDGNTGRPDEDAGTAGGGDAGEGYGFRAYERTLAGDQSLIAGIAPISPRERLEAYQRQAKGGGPRPDDSFIGGMFDAKQTADLFDAPVAAKAYQDQRLMDLKSDLEANGDRDVGSIANDDGVPYASLSDLIRDREETDILLREGAACRGLFSGGDKE